MKKNNKLKVFSFILLLLFGACKLPVISIQDTNLIQPSNFIEGKKSDTSSIGIIKWRKFFNDPYLLKLIDTAIKNNLELQIVLQELEIGKNEIKIKRGEYLPFINVGFATGFEKSGQYTRNGAVDEALEIKEGHKFPKPLPDVLLAANASWEVDIWKKLRNAKKSAVLNYLASVEGRNFMITQLVAELASAYYELQTLDNMLDILNANIDIQKNTLDVIRKEKEAAKVSQLAVNRFEAQLLNTKNLQYEILQSIVETENRIHFLTSKYPKKIERLPNSKDLIFLKELSTGIPSQLLQNRPDLKKAALELEASKLNIEVAKANFYPSIRLTAGIGFQSFNPLYLVSPASILYNFAGDMMMPVLNKNAIQATYKNANAKQIQALYNFERAILKAHLEVLNQLNAIDIYTRSYQTKEKEVDILSNSIIVSNSLYRAARADYAEVLLTQKEAIESKINLTEIQLKQKLSMINLYKSLGGGWN